MRVKTSAVFGFVLAFAVFTAQAALAQESPFLGEVQDFTDNPGRPLLEHLNNSADQFFARNSGNDVWIGYAVTARERLQGSFYHGGHGGRGMTVINGVVVSYPEKGIIPAGSERKAILYLFERSGGDSRLARVLILDLSEKYRFTIPLLWMSNVDQVRSLAALNTLLNSEASKRISEDAQPAIALHTGSEPKRILEKFVRGNRSVDLREDALLWLSYTLDAGDIDLLIDLEKDLDHPDMLERLALVYYRMESERATDRLINLARNHSNKEVRKKAIFWLGRLATDKALSELERVTEEDPEVEIKKQAVFAISRMETPGGLEALMHIARTSKSPTVRKQAIFWIGRSEDERAVAFLEEILRTK